MYDMVVGDQPVPGGVSPGIGAEAFWVSARWALWSGIPLTIAFLLLDRWRPQRLWVWLIALAWGGCVATYLSANINTFAAEHLSVVGSGDPATATRTAVYVAPFVEEATKASVLFLLAILMRYQWVSRLTAISLAGLSATAFAYVENILYYGRVYRYAAENPVGMAPEEALQQIFFMRGVMTPWAHPIFTMMTGIGLGIALRTRSKTVRVLAPLAGYLAAAFLHMAFNSSASLVGQGHLVILWIVALNLAFGVFGLAIKEVRRQGQLVRLRLTEYVQMGWLTDDDIRDSTRQMGRLKGLWYALWEPLGKLAPTVVIQRRLVELAYLRDAIERGLIDDAGYQRERELLQEIRVLRPRAILNPVGSPNYIWTRRRTAAIGWAAPHQWAPPTTNPVGQRVATSMGSGGTQCSAVDPKWGPPPG